MKTIKGYNEFLNEDLDNSYQDGEIRVKVTKCDDEKQWYWECIGKEFVVEEDDVRNRLKNGGDSWKVVSTEFNKGGKYIKKEDCEQI